MRDRRHNKTRKKLWIVLGLFLVLAAALWLSLSQSAGDHGLLKASGLPKYEGKASVTVEGNEPNFSEKKLKKKHYEKFSRLDRHGRCGPAVACIGPESMPEGERGPIGMIRPSGWQIATYKGIDNGGYLYNRCHLIGWQLTGQNAEVKNPITGTRYLNTEGMLPYENEVTSYIRRTKNHVMYRVTPYFIKRELVARGVQIEALSVEDHGKGNSFNVYCFNVQPGIHINYKNGESSKEQ